ncbi:hypothetical protein KKD70_01490 [Patescibacteria group bacterium]|nr:hypothetical protein [Patescibacteria group bacterium]
MKTHTQTVNFATGFTKDLVARFVKHFLNLAGIALFTAAFISVFAIADAYAYGTCVDLGGQSTTVGAGDAGRFDFDAEPLTPSYGAKLCAPDVPGNDFELHGWVWDTNLGWVSLACKDNSNFDIACGATVDYGVKINSQTGKMYGWAWGDNIGWISFGCSEGTNDGKSCGSTTYSGTTQIAVDADLGKMSGYAWADSVGWFNLDGIRGKVLNLVMAESTSETEFGVWTKGENSDDDSVPNKNTAQVADGKSGYDLFVHIADIAGHAVENSANIVVTITPNWIDSVKFDQVNGSDEDYSDNNDGAVSKPLETSDFLYESSITTSTGVKENYYAKIISYAPTDNFYDADGDGIYDGISEGEIYYREFGETTIPSNDLLYNGADISVTLVPTGEVWTETITPLNGGSYPMVFLPPLEFKDFHSITDATADPYDPDNQQNYVESFRNMIDYYLIKPTENIASLDPTIFSPLQINLNLTTGAPDVEYLWIDDPEVDLETLSGNSLQKLSINANELDKVQGIVQDFFGSTDFLTMALPYAPEGELQSQIPGAKAYITIAYKLLANGEVVTYFDNGVPRIADSGIVNQAAEITGNVYSSGAKNVSTNVVITSLGDISSNALQNQMLTNVSKLIAGVNTNVSMPSKVKIDGKNSITNSDYIAVGGGRGYYFKNQDIHILNVNDFPENPTIIVDGGDVYIDENVTNRIGVIVLADYADNNEATKGGHVYISNNVTDFVGHIYADGPMFRYVQDLCLSTDKYASGAIGADGLALKAMLEPNFVQEGRICTTGSGYVNPVTNLTNQLYMKGSFATYNCIGCSTGNPYRGDGQLLNGNTPLNYAIARLYDLNYFSYFREFPDSPGTYSGDRSALLPAGKNGPVYIDYSPIPADMLGFN